MIYLYLGKYDFFFFAISLLILRNKVCGEALLLIYLVVPYMDAICIGLWIKCAFTTKFLVHCEKIKGSNLSLQKLIPYGDITLASH